ncbi:hypothetical protein HYX70_02000 [Candidatus Saccharibacteria bacterium]|nr:hypothetical protein [Candidatus Saccharibacteria bacterium]
MSELPPDSGDNNKPQEPTEGEKMAADEWEGRSADAVEKDRQKLLRKVEAEQANHSRPTPYEKTGHQRPAWTDDPEERQKNYEKWVDEIRREQGLKPKYEEQDE